MKLFFQKDYYEDALTKVEEDNTKSRTWCERNLIIKNPQNSRLYYFWEIIFLFAFLIEIILVPYTALAGQIEDQLEGDTKTVERVIDGIWVINIILSFLTPQEYETGNQQDKFYFIAKQYLFPMFIFDVSSTLILFFNYQTQFAWMYYLKFLRFFYFTRAMKNLQGAIDPIVTIINISKQAKSNVQSIISSLIILFTIMHVVACGWIYVGLKEGWGTWIDNPGFDVHKFKDDPSFVYITSLYWVVTTLTTVGYGDIFGTTDAEYIYTMIVEFIGILVFSIIMSTVNSFL